MSAVDAVEAEVRELVRRGLDPIADRLAMRRLVEEVVSHYEERAGSSALSPLVDSRQAARTVYDAVAGFGPLQRHLDDPEVEEIWIDERLTAGYLRRGSCGSHGFGEEPVLSRSAGRVQRAPGRAADPRIGTLRLPGSVPRLSRRCQARARLRH